MQDDTPKPRHALPRYLRDEGVRGDVKKRSDKHERRIAKAMGGKRIARSGAVSVGRFSQWGGTKYKDGAAAITANGDVTTPDFVIEHKFIEPLTKSVGVSRVWLTKVTEGARRQMKTPAMVLTFERAHGHEQDWLLIPLSIARTKLGFTDEE